MSGKKLLIVHGGGPTPVINASLYGAVAEARAHPEVSRALGARGGCKGLLDEDFIDLSAIPERRLRLLLQTPASAIGTSRHPLEAADYAHMADLLEQGGFGWVLFNGGNGSMDACGKLCRACEGRGIGVVGIPKTVDNDIAVTDHAPGFGSAARYIASITREIGEDVRSFPIHVSVIEAMGRNAGWITAASALARRGPGGAPHIICPPEVPFDQEAFLRRVRELHERQGGVVAVVSEGLRGPDGNPVVPPVFQSGRSVYYGDVSAHLANLIIRRLGIKARSEKPGLCGRSSIAFQSPTDRDEAALAGAEAVRAALAGETGVMVGLRREPGPGYHCGTVRIPIGQVMLHERKLPDEFIAPGGFDVTPAFLDWCRPLVGGPLEEFFTLD